MKPDPLRPLIEAWRDIEPRPGFEDAVWRRIEREPAPQRGWLEILALRPVYATVAGLAAGAVIGLALSSPPAPRTGDFAMLNAGSLAGSYVQLVSGDVP